MTHENNRPLDFYVEERSALFGYDVYSRHRQEFENEYWAFSIYEDITNEELKADLHERNNV